MKQHNSRASGLAKTRAQNSGLKKAAMFEGRNLAESPLTWLATHKGKDGKPLITAIEFDAGERLRADFWFAEMTPRVTANWSLLLTDGGGRRSSPDMGPDLQDRVIAARERVRLALRSVGPELANVLIDVCCHLKGLEASERSSGWPKRSGKIFLRIALSQLARHYGLLCDDAARSGAPGKIHHWGAQDYRPRIDPETT